MTQRELLSFRDKVLEGLRVQFACKVAAVIDPHLKPMDIEAFLQDLANNVAQGFAAEPTYMNIEGCALADHEVMV
jgi:hypothetical protein